MFHAGWKGFCPTETNLSGKVKTQGFEVMGGDPQEYPCYAVGNFQGDDLMMIFIYPEDFEGLLVPVEGAES